MNRIFKSLNELAYLDGLALDTDLSVSEIYNLSHWFKFDNPMEPFIVECREELWKLEYE